jgi:hypothetical protein
VEAEGEHAAQGGAIAHSVCGKRVVNFTSLLGDAFCMRQPCSARVLQSAVRYTGRHLPWPLPR